MQPRENEVSFVDVTEGMFYVLVDILFSYVEEVCVAYNFPIHLMDRFHFLFLESIPLRMLT
jgi:hypothetical protein